MIKITFMGAGSTVFAKNVLGDCMLTESLQDSQISLYDINSQRLDESFLMLSAINKNCNEGRAIIKKYLGKPLMERTLLLMLFRLVAMTQQL